MHLAPLPAAQQASKPATLPIMPTSSTIQSTNYQASSLASKLLSSRLQVIDQLLMLGIILLLFFLMLPYPQGAQSIGVNYGRVASDLPPPEKVAHFILTATIISRVRLFDADPVVLRAFALTGIPITVTIPNDEIHLLTNFTAAQQWVGSAISPFISAGTNIIRILVGNEVLSTTDKTLILSLVPAMEILHAALVAESLDRRIQISTPHSLGLLAVSSPPSAGRFRSGYDTHVIIPLLAFLKSIGSPFMVNPYPFFACTPDTLDFALFRSAQDLFDEMSWKNYSNMFDAQMDAVFAAMSKVGYADVDIVVAETGWPSAGDPSQIGVDSESAAMYNRRLIEHVSSGVGTPLMPNRTFETYIFALFDENLKTGPTDERHFGLIKSNLTPAYNAGILRRAEKSAACSGYSHGVVLSVILLLGSLQ